MNDTIFNDMKQEYKDLSAARSEDSTPDELVRLAVYGSEKVKQNVAYNTKTPLQSLQYLAETGSEVVQCWVALNKNTTGDILHKLAFKSTSDLVKMHIVQNDNVFSETLDYLARIGTPRPPQWKKWKKASTSSYYNQFL